MKQVLAILLALLIPMQSAWSAIGPIENRLHAGCAQTLSIGMHQDHAGTQAAGVSDCGDCGGLSHAGAPTFVHHHGCAHFGVVMVTAATAAASPPAPAGAAPDSKHASFESVVLDVPSPPPTTGA